MKRHVEGVEKDRKKAGRLGGYGGAPVEEFPGPEPEEVVRMEPQDRMSEGAQVQQTELWGLV